MVGDEIRDGASGRVYVVTWDGGKSSSSLIGTDERYTRQRSNATAHYTSGALGDVGIRPEHVKCRVGVDWPWR